MYIIDRRDIKMLYEAKRELNNVCLNGYLQELVSVHGHHELVVTDDQARLAPHLSNAIRTRAH